MEGPRRSPRTIWIAAGLLVLGLVVLVLGPLSSLGTNNRTEALFTESPDAASLTALGSFTDAAPGDTREGAAALETDTAALPGVRHVWGPEGRGRDVRGQYRSGQYPGDRRAGDR